MKKIILFYALTFSCLAFALDDVLPDNSIDYQLPGLTTKLLEKYTNQGMPKTIRAKSNYKGSFQMNYFATGTELEPVSKILYSNSEKMYLGDQDIVFMTPIEKAHVGDLFLVYKETGSHTNQISDRTAYSYQIIGEIRIKALREDLTVGIIENSIMPVERNSKITTPIERNLSPTPKAANQRIEGVVVGFANDTASKIGTYEICYIDRGKLDGVENGNIFRAFEYNDKFSGKLITEENILPMADIIVIHTEQKFSTGLVIESKNLFPTGTIVALRTNIEDMDQKTSVQSVVLSDLLDKNSDKSKNTSKDQKPVSNLIDVELDKKDEKINKEKTEEPKANDDDLDSDKDESINGIVTKPVEEPKEPVVESKPDEAINDKNKDKKDESNDEALSTSEVESVEPKDKAQEETPKETNSSEKKSDESKNSDEDLDKDDSNSPTDSNSEKKAEPKSESNDKAADETKSSNDSSASEPTDTSTEASKEKKTKKLTKEEEKELEDLLAD